LTQAGYLVIIGVDTGIIYRPKFQAQKQIGYHTGLSVTSGSTWHVSWDDPISSVEPIYETNFGEYIAGKDSNDVPNTIQK
jgi:hypothetical protein